MKKHILLLTIILLINVLLPSCRTPGDDASQTDAVTTEPVVPSHHPVAALTEEVSIPADGAVNDFYIADNVVYMTTRNRIEKVPLDQGNDPERTIVYEHNPDAAAQDDPENKLLTLDIVEEKIYVIKGLNHPELLELSMTGELQRSWPIDHALQGRGWGALEVKDNRAFFVNQTPFLYSLDLTQDNPPVEEIRNLGWANLQGLDFYDENTLIIHNYAEGVGNSSSLNGMWVYAYDLPTGEITTLYENGAGSQNSLSTTAADYSMGKVFVADGDFVYRITLPEDKDEELIFEKYHYMANNQTDDAMATMGLTMLVVTENCIIYRSTKGVLNVEIPGTVKYEEGKTVTLFGVARDDQKYYYHFISEFERDTGYTVRFAEIDGQSYSEKLRLKLLAGDSDFDVFPINSPYMLQQGAYEPLNGYANIMENMNEMFDGLTELMTHNGQVYGVPYAGEIQTYRMSAEASQYLDHIPPLNWSVDDIFLACEELLDEGGTVSLYDSDDIKLYSVMKECIDACLNEEFDLFGATHTKDAEKNLRDMIAKLEDYHKKGVLLGENGLVNRTSDGAMYRFRMATNETLLMTPAYHSGDKTLTHVGGLAINPNSANKEGAATFLSYITDEPYRYVIGVMQGMFFPEPDRYTLFSKTNKYLPKSAAMDMLFDALPKIYPNLQSEWLAVYPNHLNPYLNGEMDVDKLAETIFEDVRYFVCE